jgi:acyl-ACP thioesterase
MLRYTSDLAGEDYNERGLTWQELQKQGIVFLVSRMTLRIHRLIPERETVTIATYERGVEGPYCIRNYMILGEGGDVAVSAKSAWIVCEPASRRILRPSMLPMPIESHPDRDVDCPDPHRIRIPESTEYAGDRPVVYSDIDANGHVNNSVYADIACDHLPPALLMRPVRDFAIVFRREAKPGEVIRVYRRVDESDGDVTDDVVTDDDVTADVVTNAIVTGAVGGETSFECSFGWNREE